MSLMQKDLNIKSILDQAKKIAEPPVKKIKQENMSLSDFASLTDFRPSSPKVASVPTSVSANTSDLISALTQNFSTENTDAGSPSVSNFNASISALLQNPMKQENLAEESQDVAN